MLSGVSSMQTGARCARNHRKPGISAACVPASSPHALKLGREVMVSVCKTERQTTHPHSANPPSGRDVKTAEQSQGTGGAGAGGATLFAPPDFAALSWSGNVGVEGSAPPAKNGPDAFFPAASSLPVCRSQYGRRRDGLLPLKLSGAAGRGPGGIGGAPTARILPACHHPGEHGPTCHAPP